MRAKEKPKFQINDRVVKVAYQHGASARTEETFRGEFARIGTKGTVQGFVNGINDEWTYDVVWEDGDEEPCYDGEIALYEETPPVEAAVVNPVFVEINASLLRKMQPIGTVARDYFPLARRAEAAVSWLGNEKHNPGEPLHWARGKSDDHLDCLMRHATEAEDWDTVTLPDGRVFQVLHAAEAAWRASALAQLAAEKYDGVVIRQLNTAPPVNAPKASPTGIWLAGEADPRKHR